MRSEKLEIMDNKELVRESYEVFVKAVLAGMMICFGCIVFMSCSEKIVGATLFSFGLLTIVCRGLWLYTGKIGYLRQVGFRNILLTIAGNLVGSIILGSAINATRYGEGLLIKAQALSDAKLDDSLISIFILSIACGVMMYLAVDSYRKCKSWLFVILPVVIFIMCGFEHSIANMGYFTIAGAWSMKAALYILVMAVGNGVGSAIMNVATYKVRGDV